MPSSQKLQIWLKPNCTWMFIGWSSTNFRFFVTIWNSKWQLRQDLIKTLWEKCFKTLLLWNHLPPLGQLQPNCPGIIIWWSSKKIFFSYADRKFKMAATTGHSINTGPYGENREICSSLKLLHWLNLNCINHWKVLYKLCFFMLIGIPSWLPLQDIVFT